jgi:MFS family permease
MAYDATVSSAPPSPPLRPAIAAATNTTWVSWYSLSALILVSLYAVMDRAVFGLLAESMRKDMGLSDLQLGLLQGVALSLVSAVAAFPVAWAADRFDRRAVMIACVVMWSVALVGCALAPNFGWLMIGSGLVGIGETGLATIIFAAMPDLFDNKRLPFANAVAAIGKQVSGAVGVMLCGVVIAGVEIYRSNLPAGLQDWALWRLSFLGTLIGLPFALLLLASLPRRVGRSRTAVGPGGDIGAGGRAGFLRHLRRHARAVLGFIAGMFLVMFSLACVGVWLPVIVIRYFGMSPVEVAGYAGVYSLISGGVGFTLGMLAFRLLSPRFGWRTPILLVAAPCVLMLPFAFGMLLARTGAQYFACAGGIATLIMISVMYFPTLLQQTSPGRYRARVFSLFAVAGLVAGAISPPFVGAISDLLTGVDRPLLLASVSTAPVSAALGVLLIWWSSGGYLAAVADSQEDA